MIDPKLDPSIAALIAEWDAEVEAHGLWTSGHSIANRMASALRAVRSPQQEDYDHGPDGDATTPGFFTRRGNQASGHVSSPPQEPTGVLSATAPDSKEYVMGDSCHACGTKIQGEPMWCRQCAEDLAPEQM